MESIDYGKLTIVGWDVGGRDKSVSNKFDGLHLIFCRMIN